MFKPVTVDGVYFIDVAEVEAPATERFQITLGSVMVLSFMLVDGEFMVMDPELSDPACLEEAYTTYRHLRPASDVQIYFKVWHPEHALDAHLQPKIGQPLTARIGVASRTAVPGIVHTFVGGIITDIASMVLQP